MHRVCPDCGGVAFYNSYFKAWICECGWFMRNPAVVQNGGIYEQPGRHYTIPQKEEEQHKQGKR